MEKVEDLETVMGGGYSFIGNGDGPMVNVDFYNQHVIISHCSWWPTSEVNQLAFNLLASHLSANPHHKVISKSFTV